MRPTVRFPSVSGLELFVRILLSTAVAGLSSVEPLVMSQYHATLDLVADL